MRAAVFALASLLALSACGGPHRPGGPGLADSPDGWGNETAGMPRFKGERLTPEVLKGLTTADLEDRLGPPSFRRRDPPAEIWQYRVKSCTLDLFIYPEKDYRVVAHYAARTPKGAPPVSDIACLDEVQAQGRDRPVS